MTGCKVLVALISFQSLLLQSQLFRKQLSLSLFYQRILMKKKVIKDSTEGSVLPFSAKKPSAAPSRPPSMANVSIQRSTAQSVTNSITTEDISLNDQPTAVIAPAGKLSLIVSNTPTNEYIWSQTTKTTLRTTGSRRKQRVIRSRRCHPIRCQLC